LLLWLCLDMLFVIDFPYQWILKYYFSYKNKYSMFFFISYHRVSSELIRHGKWAINTRKNEELENPSYLLSKAIYGPEQLLPEAINCLAKPNFTARNWLEMSIALKMEHFNTARLQVYGIMHSYHTDQSHASS